MFDPAFFRDASNLDKILDMFGDDAFWVPFNHDEAKKIEFDALVDEIEESKTWTREMNQRKGVILEDFAVFLFSRFKDVKIRRNLRHGDNEIDVEVTLSERGRPESVNDYIGPKILCECKNHSTSSVDVGMISKLAELLKPDDARCGLFISIQGIGGSGWRFGEGKRKKLFNQSRLPIISFTLDELKRLKEDGNFLTMIKQKIRALRDEVDDDSPELPTEGHLEYNKRLHLIVEHFEKIGILSTSERTDIKERLLEKYGVFDE